jgi:hypothetical protein
MIDKETTPGWEVLPAEDQAHMTDMMREHPPAQFMLGMRISDYQPAQVEAELLAKWLHIYEADKAARRD